MSVADLDKWQPTAEALGKALAVGARDAGALCADSFARIDRHGDAAVFISLTRERAEAEAAASAARHRAGRARGPLDGVPIAWKDLIDLRDTVTTAGSATHRDAPAARRDATIVERLGAAGMVSVGKTNLSEFAYSGLGLNPHFGTPRNPADPVTARVPGGSSSGSAVAVAAGLVPVAIGTDTGGSIRIPAAFNGIVGFKTSEGRIDKSGVFPLSETLDTVGILALSVADCLLVDAALRGKPPERRAPRRLREIRIVVPENVVFDDAEPAVVDRFRIAMAALSAAGAAVAWRHLPVIDDVQRITRDHGTVTIAEAYRLHRDLVEGPRAGEVDPRVTARILNGKKMSAFDLLEIQAGRARLRRQIAADLDGAFLAMPTVAHVAPEIAPLDADPQLFHTVNLRTLRNTMLGNFLDLCGLSLPAGRDRQGLPIGLLLSAPGGDDDALLAAGLAAEAVLREAFQ